MADWPFRTQEEAIKIVNKACGYPDDTCEGGHQVTCSGNVDTCPNDECLVCGARDCPGGEPLHYHHNGCPLCDAELDWDQEDG